MDTNGIPDEADDLRYELKKLKMELERSNLEKADAAEFGLVILEEKNMLRSMLEQKENVLESLKAQLACAQEAFSAMQCHNKALEEADIAEEEKRIIQDDRVRKEIENLEMELKNWKKQSVQSVEEKEKLEDLLKQFHIHNDKLKIQIQKLKEDLKDYEFREISALKNYDILESDNVELQQQVSHLLKTVQQQETFQSDNRKLAEKNEELLNELESYRILKMKMENNLQETNEMLREEREMRMTYKRELDARILSEEGSCLDASTVASIHSFFGGPSSMVGDFSIDNISALLDGFIINNDEKDGDDVDKEESICNDENNSNTDVIKISENDTRLKDSLEDISCSDFHQNNKINNNDTQMNKHVKMKKKKSKDLLSELMVTHEDYVASIEKLEIDNFRLNKLVDELNLALDSVSCQQAEMKDNSFISDDEPKRDQPMRSFASTQTGAECDHFIEDDKAKMENALRCLHGVRRYLLDMVSEAQSTYTTLCNAADESLNSKAMKHVEARKSSIEAKISRFYDNNNSDRRIPSFMLSGSFHDLHKKAKRACEDAPEAEKDSISGIEVDCTKLLASSIDLMRYSRRVANRMLDCKMAAKMRESSSPISSFSSSISTNGFPAAHHHQHHSSNQPSALLKASSSFELQEQVFQLQSLVSAKSEQMTSLRQMLSANKTVYESSIEKLKHQYESEMDAKIHMIDDLKKTIDEMKENEGMKFVSEQSLIKKCDHFSCQMNDLNERLSASELERKTLNSLLRIAIQHKLVLLKKLQNHGIPVDLSSNQDSRDQSPNQSEPKRTSCPSPRPPIGTRFQHFHVPKQPSFTPLLYSPSKKK